MFFCKDANFKMHSFHLFFSFYRYLPVTEKKKDESHEEFASRVQGNMAKSLNLQAYSYSYTDISQYVKERDRVKGILSIFSPLFVSKSLKSQSEIRYQLSV